jgi:fatty-acid peroxygenase
MQGIPSNKSVEGTLVLAFEGYRFISKKCRRYRSGIFQTRRMHQRAICMREEETAWISHEDGRFAPSSRSVISSVSWIG